MAHTAFQKAVKKALDSTTEAIPDQVVCHKDGMVSVKRGYFYRFGATAQSWGDKVVEALLHAGVRATLRETADHYRAWPQDSFLVAVVEQEA